MAEWNEEDDLGNLNLAPLSCLQNQRGGWGIAEFSDLYSVRSVVLKLHKIL